MAVHPFRDEVTDLERHHGTATPPVPSQETRDEQEQRSAEVLSALDKRLNSNYFFGCETITDELQVMSLSS